jgi:hypothetical protein
MRRWQVLWVGKQSTFTASMNRGKGNRLFVNIQHEEMTGSAIMWKHSRLSASVNRESNESSIYTKWGGDLVLLLCERIPDLTPVWTGSNENPFVAFLGPTPSSLSLSRARALSSLSLLFCTHDLRFFFAATTIHERPRFELHFWQVE